MSITLGEAAKQATEFLDRLHDDVARMISTLDAAFDERGLVPVEPNRISRDLGNGLRSEHWVLHFISRLYVPKPMGRADRAIAFGVHFAPEAVDHATCLVAAGRFQSETQATAIWDAWADSTEIVGAIVRRGEVGPVHLRDNPIRAKLFPAAVAGEAFILPLDRLETPDLLNELVVLPAMRALGE